MQQSSMEGERIEEGKEIPEDIKKKWSYALNFISAVRSDVTKRKATAE